MVDIFSVIADHTRRELLQALLAAYVSPQGEISVGDLVEKLGASQPTVSKQLKVLREAGLVSVREEGQHRYYQLDTEPLEALEDWLIPYLSADFDTDDADDADESAEPNVIDDGGGFAIPIDSKAYGEAVGRALAEVSHGAATVGQAATGSAKKAQQQVKKGIDWVTGIARN